MTNTYEYNLLTPEEKRIGKWYFPGEVNIKIHNPRIFFSVLGVFANVADATAAALDNHHIADVNGVIPYKYFEGVYAKSIIDAVREEDSDFYYNLPRYDWHQPLLQKLFELSNGSMFPLCNFNSQWQLTGLYMWVLRNFGDAIIGKRAIFIDDEFRSSVLVQSSSDVLIDCNLENIQSWVEAGGTAFYYPEIHVGCYACESNNNTTGNKGGLICSQCIAKKNVVEVMASRLSQLENVLK